MKSKVRQIVCGVLSFFLCFILFVFSFVITLQATLFNSSYILDNMDQSNYFVDKCDELRDELVDLGNASGLEESFFDDLVTSSMLRSDTEKFIDDYYETGEARIDTTTFKQTFNAALDEYIEKNDVTVASSADRDYLVNKAAGIYSSELRLPMSDAVSKYFMALKGALPWAIAVLVVCIAGLCAVLIFTNEWKHRAVRYICYAVSGAFLAVGVIPAAMLATGIVSKINLASRALYNLFVMCANEIAVALAVCSIIYLIISAGLFFLHRRLRRKVSESDE